MSKIVVVPLGTISPYTKGNMNCPGFLIRYGNQKILLDCGNGITSLLNFPYILNNLNVIVTHYHKDHFGDIGILGYASYVYHNLGVLKEKVNVYLPKEDYCYNKKAIISNKDVYFEYIDIDDNYSFNIKNLNISFCDNKSHTITSYMVKLENSKNKLVYTSDVGVTNFEQLIEFCRDSDLIISESSFLKKHNSDCKTHLTAHDAGVLAKEANAKKLLLTHFWPEENKQLYLDEARSVFENTEVAVEGKKLVLK